MCMRVYNGDGGDCGGELCKMKISTFSLKQNEIEIIDQAQGQSMSWELQIVQSERETANPSD